MSDPDTDFSTESGSGHVCCWKYVTIRDILVNAVLEKLRRSSVFL